MGLETTATCVVCRRRPARNSQTCDGCRTHTDGHLADIAGLYVYLYGQFEKGRRAGDQRVSGSREAPLPLRIDPLDLTMPAPTGRQRWSPILDGQTGYTGVAALLDTWARDWCQTRDMREHPPVPTVATLVVWLRHRLEWACDNHPDVDQFAAHMRRLHTILRNVCDLRTDRVYIGDCPVTTDKGPCATPLTADPYLDLIRCTRCRSQWTRDKWLWLGATLRDVQGEAA